MTYSIKTSKRFEKDLKLCQRRGLNMKLVFDAIELLRTTGKTAEGISAPPFERPKKRPIGMSYSAGLADDVGAEQQGIGVAIP